MNLNLKTEDVEVMAAALNTMFIHTGNTTCMALSIHLTNLINAEQYRKPEPELKVLVSVDEGNIQYILSTKEINLTVIDHDNMREGDIELEENSYPVEIVSPGFIETRIAEVYNDYHLQNKKG